MAHKAYDWRPFGPRDPHENHRVSTPLELLFDLVIVIAVASAAEGLHHAIVQGHAAQGIMLFAFAFFATWWAWVNFTWFASAYDNDGPIYRLLTLWIMGGALVLAAGIPHFFAGLDLTFAIIGYAVMRVGMIAFWLISARSDPRHRTTALTYAIGIALVQVYWILALAVLRPAGENAAPVLFVVGIVLELAVPALAERRGATPWHRHHIMERHGLFVIIVLGEVLLSGASAFGLGAQERSQLGPLLLLALSALAITFAMWWLYFSQEGVIAHESLRGTLHWGYLHALIFASGAGVGAGFLVVLDSLRGHARIGATSANLAVAIPLAVYMATLWLVRDRLVLTGAGRLVLLAFAVLMLGAALLPELLALPAMALLGAACVALRVRVQPGEA
jgi:low temperature requirement protein LtrA